MTRIRLAVALMIVTLVGLFAGGCQKPFLVPTAFDLNADGAFYLERFFGQRYEDDDEEVHMSTGLRLWLTDTIPIVSPVDGIMEWCPPGVWCDQAQGYGTIRVTLKPKKDQVNELQDVKAVPMYVLIGGLQGDKVKAAVKALHLAEEADDPANPSTTEEGEAETFATNFVKYGEAEPEAFVVRMGDVLGLPRAIGAASLGPRGRITITVLDPKGYFLDPMIYLNLETPPAVTTTAPVQALGGDTTPPEITQVTMYGHGSMSGTNALGVQTVDIGGTSVSSVVVPSLFDITVGVRDVGPPRCDSDSGTVTCLTPDPGFDATMAIKRFDVEIFGLDPVAPPASPTVGDYTHQVLTTPYQAGLFCLAEANARLDGSGESDVGSDVLYNPYEPPTSKTSPHVYNLANLRARPEAECLPETWRDEEVTTAGGIDTTAFAQGEYKVVVTATDFADQTDTYETWMSVTTAQPTCDLEVSSCTAQVSFDPTPQATCGSGDPLTKVNLSLDIPPPSAICQGIATLTVPQGDVEMFLNPDCTGAITTGHTWDLSVPEAVPPEVYIRAANDPQTGQPIAFQEVVMALTYTNGATCTGTNNTVLQGGNNPGPAEYEGGCCTENGSPGCESETIAACVCALDSGCCTGDWTETCIEYANDNCQANCPAIDSECGNGVCEINESPSTCPGDCPSPPPNTFEDCAPSNQINDFDISNSTVVPFSVNLSSGGIIFNGQDDAGLCNYELVVPTLAIETETLFVKSLDLSNVTLTWKEAAAAFGSGASQTFHSAVLTWETNGAAAGSFGVIDAQITEATIAVDAQGNVTGVLDFEANTSADVNLGPNVILRSGVEGTFSYAYSGGTDWTGSWNFGGITGIHLDVVKTPTAGSNVVATATGSLQPNGVLEATLVQTPGTSFGFTSYGLGLNICDLSLNFSYNIANSHLDFLSGGAALSATGIGGLTGSIDLVLTFEPTQATVALGLNLGCTCCAGASQLEVVGMTLSDLSLTGVFNYDFDLLSLVGTVSAQHPDFNTAIEGVVFKVEDLGGGSGLGVSEFSMASFTTEFQGFELSVTNASYITAGSELTFSAKLVIPNLGDFSIINFKCNDAGLISIQKISGALTQSPLTGSFQASYYDDGNTSRFTGYINDLSVAGLVTVGAEIDVGTAQNSGGKYTFIYIKIKAANLPIPLVKKLAATGGYNYGMQGIPGCPPTSPAEICTPFGSGGGGGEEVNAPGYPSEGTYIVGFGLGIGDPAGIISLDLYAQVQFGNGPTQLTAAAGISIPQTDPWISGTVTIDNYILGGSDMAGSLSTNVSIPGDNPWFFHFNGAVTYETSDSGWSVETPYPITANLLSVVQVTGNFNFSSVVSTNPNSLENSFSGSINASLSVGGGFSFRYPNNFNPSSCSTADATDNSIGFGARGNLSLGVTGSIGGSFDNDGLVSANIGANAYFNGYLAYKLPCPAICYNCVSSISVSASAGLSASQSGQGLRVTGYANFSSSFGVTVQEYVDKTF